MHVIVHYASMYGICYASYLMAYNQCKRLYNLHCITNNYRMFFLVIMLLFVVFPCARCKRKRRLQWKSHYHC